METITIDKRAISEIAKLVSELEDRIESIELMSNTEVMEAHKRAKEQIKKREFSNWNEL